MAKPSARRPPENRNHDHAALRLLDAAFCVDASRRLKLVEEALAADDALRGYAERWAEDRASSGASAALSELVCGALPGFLRTFAASETRSERMPFDAAWRQRLANVGEQLAASEELASRFNDQLATAKIDALKEFAYGAGHEINNPLANISARAQTLLRDETHGERRRALATINRQAMRAHEMIADLMLFARPPQIECTNCDTAAIVRRVVEELSPMAGLQATQLSCQIAEEPLNAFVDAAQLAVAVKAVTRNAIEAVAAGGNVRVEARVGQVKRKQTLHREKLNPRRPDTVPQTDAASPIGLPTVPTTPAEPEPEPANNLLEIAIHDNGPGFTAREEAHLFDPFFSGREAGRGLGFGLCLAWRIVTDHGGQIAVMSEPARGATVVLTLPAG